MSLTFALWTRRIHRLASICVCLPILFFAVSGLMANHPGWFSDTPPAEVPALPSEYRQDPDRLTRACGALLPGATSAEVTTADATAATVMVHAPDGRGLVCQVDRQTGAVVLRHRHPLPAVAGKEALIAALMPRVEGTLVADSVEEDGARISFDTESVWGRTTVHADRSAGHYETTRHPMPVASAITALHRGRHAGWMQSLILDLTAGLLALTTLTGVLLAGQSGGGRLVLLALLGAAVLAFLVFVLHR